MCRKFLRFAQSHAVKHSSPSLRAGVADIPDCLERFAFLVFFCLVVDFLVDLDILDASLF